MCAAAASAMAKRKSYPYPRSSLFPWPLLLLRMVAKEEAPKALRFKLHDSRMHQVTPMP